MAYVSLYICDHCQQAGFLKKAVVSYRYKNQEYHCCKTHLKFFSKEKVNFIGIVQPSIEINFLKR